jgi:hypothetical protein
MISSTDIPEIMADSSNVMFELRKPTNEDMKLKQAQLLLLAAGKLS